MAKNSFIYYLTAFTQQARFHLKEGRNFVWTKMFTRHSGGTKKFSHDDYAIYKGLHDELRGTRKQNTISHVQLDFLFYFVCSRNKESHE
jgi:hypothetical protein